MLKSSASDKNRLNWVGVNSSVGASHASGPSYSKRFFLLSSWIADTSPGISGSILNLLWHFIRSSGMRETSTVMETPHYRSKQYAATAFNKLTMLSTILQTLCSQQTMTFSFCLSKHAWNTITPIVLNSGLPGPSPLWR
jgi:hypothetical protein